MRTQFEACLKKKIAMTGRVVPASAHHAVTEAHERAALRDAPDVAVRGRHADAHHAQRIVQHLEQRRLRWSGRTTQLLSALKASRSIDMEGQPAAPHESRQSPA